MAYQTGTANDAADLKSILETFAAANGWALASGALGKSGCYVKLTAGDGNRELKIQGANSQDFLTQPCAGYGRAWVDAAQWPLTYHLFAHASPDTVVCVIHYNVNYHQWLAFGNASKFGTWTGGNWFGGSLQSPANVRTRVTDSCDLGTATSSSGALFWNNNQNYFRSSFLHIEIDGYIWPGSEAVPSTQPWPNFPTYAYPLHARCPSAWNAQSTLTPFWLFFTRAADKISLIAELGHIRAIRVDNYNPGDILTIGADQWKVFPWYLKNTSARDGADGSPSNGFHSGTLGWAIRYDGP